MKYDPELIERLVREARDGDRWQWKYAAQAIPLLRAMANQLEAARREIELMRPVVEAAGQWRDDRPPVGVYLQACIDAYRAAKGKAGT